MVYLLVALILIGLIVVYLPKKAAYILTALLVVVLAVALLVYWKDEQEQDKFAKVAVSMVLDAEQCEPEQPLGYQIHNGTKETLYRVAFNFAIYRQGYSVAVARPYAREVKTDKIMAPGDNFTGCTRMPALKQPIPAEELLFRIERKRVWLRPPIHN